MILRHRRTTFLSFLPGSCFVMILATAFWFPALVWRQTVIHGDIPALSIPYVDFFSSVIWSLVSPIWSDQLYGGHPIFAEGQLGFVQPLNLFWAAVVTPLVGAIYSTNLFHWALMNFAGIGIIGLCRSLGASSWASAFAAIAVVFSGIWTHEQYSLPVFLTLSWIPWCLWAMEEWLKRLTFRSAVLFGGACALVFLSGYPQGLHGVIIYGVASLLIVPFHAASRTEWAQSWHYRLQSGLIAGAMCAGLVAIQLFPLLELIELSHRSGGIGLAFQNPLLAYLRGQLFTSDVNNAFFYKPGVGSVLVCVLASWVIFCRAPPRVVGHLIATIVLLQLGIESASPLFRFVYEHRLLPGLNYFRIMHIYLGIAAIGIGVAAAFAVDGVAAWVARSRDLWSILQPIKNTSKIVGFLIMAAFWGFWIWVLISLQVAKFSALHIAVPIAAGVAFAILISRQRPNLVGPIYVLLLFIECIGLRIQPFKFFDRDILAVPPAVTAIKANPEWQDYKFMTVSTSGLASLTPPLAPELPDKMRKMMAAISPMTNLMSNIASMNAHMALPLKRRTESEVLLQDDIFGRSATIPGLRLIDFLAVRFVTLDGPANTAAFRQIHFNDQDKIWTLENTSALPRFQIFTDYQFVESLDEALEAVRKMKRRTLIIERPQGFSDPEVATEVGHGAADPSVAARFDVVEATSTRYVFRISAAKSAWLFVADTNYPGWTASIDGHDVPVFTAQILGKAVAVLPGNHELTIQFRSKSLLWGLLISLFTLVAIACTIGISVWRTWRKRLVS